MRNTSSSSQLHLSKNLHVYVVVTSFQSKMSEHDWFKLVFKNNIQETTFQRFGLLKSIMINVFMIQSTWRIITIQPIHVIQWILSFFHNNQLHCSFSEWSLSSNNWNSVFVGYVWSTINNSAFFSLFQSLVIALKLISWSDNKITINNIIWNKWSNSTNSFDLERVIDFYRSRIVQFCREKVGEARRVSAAKNFLVSRKKFFRPESKNGERANRGRKRFFDLTSVSILNCVFQIIEEVI